MTWPQELSALEPDLINHDYEQVPVWLTEFGWPGNGPRSSCAQLGGNQGAGYCPAYATRVSDLKAAYADLLSPRPSFVTAARAAADDFKALAAATLSGHSGTSDARWRLTSEGEWGCGDTDIAWIYGPPPIGRCPRPRAAWAVRDA